MSTLPLELLLLIADYLDVLPLLALSRTCHSLHHLLTPLLHTHVPNLAATVVPWSARHHRLDHLQLALPHLPRRYVISKSHQDGLLSRLISAGDIEIVRILLRNRMVDPEGGGWPSRVRPLLTAVYARNLEVIKLLLDAGASVGLGNPAPAEVVWRLEKRHDGEMMGLLKNARPGNKWLERLGDQNDEGRIGFLIDRKLVGT